MAAAGLAAPVVVAGVGGVEGVSGLVRGSVMTERAATWPPCVCVCVCVCACISVIPVSDMMGPPSVTHAGTHTQNGTHSGRKVIDKSHCLAGQPVCISLSEEERGGKKATL